MNKPCLWRLEHIHQPGRERPRLNHVTVDIPAGITAILGPSGSGKTSLLNLLVGFERPAAGTAMRLDAEAPPVIDRGLRLPVFWSPADHGLWPHLTVREHLESVMPDGTACKENVDRLLQQFDLTPLMTAYPATLSMGERDRLSIARAVTSGAEVIVLDEPFARVDAERREKGWHALREYAAASHSLVFATQQWEVAAQHADWVIVLDQGRVQSSGMPLDLTPTRSEATNITLRLLGMLLITLGLCGCQFDAESNIPPKSERTWSLPADGTKVPAPRGITAGPNGEIYVLDNIGRVLILDDKGNLTRSWWMPEYSVGKPERLLVCRDGRLAVADTHYHRIVIFNDQGEVLSMFGHRGSGPGEFEYPVAIAEDDRDNLYVCEYGGNDRVQIFRPDGTYVGTFGSFGTGPGQFQRPSGIVWRDKKLYIVDAFNNRVHVCDETGVAVPLPPGAFSAELHYPYDVSLTEEGTVYVVEYGAGRVTWFSNDGRLLGRTGITGGGSGQLYTPWGLSMDRNGTVWIADTGNRRVVNWELRH